MFDLRKKIETWFENFAFFIIKNRIKAILFVLLVTVSMGSQIPKLRPDLSMEGLLRHDDPTLISYNAYRDDFGRDDYIVIAINHPRIFETGFLKKLKMLHEEIEAKVPYVSDVTSIINANQIYGRDNELIVENLTENWPENEEEMGQFKNRMLSNALYKNLLLSEDGEYTAIIIKTVTYKPFGTNESEILEFDDMDSQDPDTQETSDELQYLSDLDTQESVIAIHEILESYKDEDFNVYLSGSPVINHFLTQAMFNDMALFITLEFITIIIFLYLMFRTIAGIILPLFVVMLASVSSMGIMAGFGIPLTLPTQIIPTFLTVVGVGGAVHILAVFYQQLRYTDSKEDAIVYTMGHSALPIIMTNLTTGCGLLSFANADIASVGHLGIFASIGVMLLLIYTLIMLPALIALLPIKKQYDENNNRKAKIMDHFLSQISKFSVRYHIQIIIFSGILMLISLYLASGIRFRHYPINDWLPKDNEARIATKLFDKEMKGSLTLEITIDTGKENGLHDPDILNRLEKAVVDMESIVHEDLVVEKAMSIVTILKQIHQALNENRQDHFKVPQSRDLVSQEFLLYESSGSDDLKGYVDSQFSKTRLSIKVPFRDALQFIGLITNVKNYFSTHFPDEEISTTGMVVLLVRILENTITSMVDSYIIAFSVITILMILLIGGIRIGVLSMIPNIAPILLMLAMMRIFSLSMDVNAILVSSIAIGLVVDDTIHFMYNFRRYYKQSGDPELAVHNTLMVTGRAMLVTTIVLSTGFFIYMFSKMGNMFNFGLLTGYTICMALIADFFLAPALMVFVNKKTIISHELPAELEV